MHVLSFQLSQERLETSKGTPYFRVEVYPLVDGQHLFTQAGQYLFNAGQVLTTGVKDGKFDPFTCSCGSAACAGIHMPCEITKDEVSVTWSLPAEPFEAAINQKFAKRNSDLTLSFSRAQYEHALAKLADDLYTLSYKGKLPLSLLGDEPSDDYLQQPLSKRITPQHAV